MFNLNPLTQSYTRTRYFVRTNSARCVLTSMYNVPVFMTIFRTDNPFRIVIIPSLLSFCDCFPAFFPIITFPLNPLVVGCVFVVTPPIVALPNTFVSTPFNNSAVPALLLVCALLVIPNALRFVGDTADDDDANNDPGDGVLRRLDDENAEVCFNDGFNGFEAFFFGTILDVVGCMAVVLLSFIVKVAANPNASVGAGDFVATVVVSTVLLSLLLLLLLLQLT